ncbi:unnamed protein product [Effrenium voratum]|uniref:Uncharacterized protein n=1 Tax=Effrenium voratum TaxID=2562239 RepID=A0AA36I964_9DINO|nr:unnamed protein product [Effrenium voratum]
MCWRMAAALPARNTTSAISEYSAQLLAYPFFFGLTLLCYQLCQLLRVPMKLRFSGFLGLHGMLMMSLVTDIGAALRSGDSNVSCADNLWDCLLHLEIPSVLLFDIVWANMGYVLALEYGTNNLLALKEGNFEPRLHSLILWGLARLCELSILHRAAGPLWKLMEGYYYGLSLAVTNLSVALVPIAMVSFPVMQLTLMCADRLEEVTSLVDIIRYQTKCFVPVISQEYFQRPWCVAELATAFLHNVPLVPLLIDGFAFSEDGLQTCEQVCSSFQGDFFEHLQVSSETLRAAYEHISGMKSETKVSWNILNRNDSVKTQELAMLNLAETVQSISRKRASSNVPPAPYMLISTASKARIFVCASEEPEAHSTASRRFNFLTNETN